MAQVIVGSVVEGGDTRVSSSSSSSDKVQKVTFRGLIATSLWSTKLVPPERLCRHNLLLQHHFFPDLSTRISPGASNRNMKEHFRTANSSLKCRFLLPFGSSRISVHNLAATLGFPRIGVLEDTFCMRNSNTCLLKTFVVHGGRVATSSRPPVFRSASSV